MKNNFVNIHYDKNSRYKFDELNESLFIKRLIQNLSEVMGGNFFQYEFFIFSQHGNQILPDSIDFISENKKVLIFISDESGSDPVSYSNQYYAIFKAYIGTTSLKNVFPLPLGYVKNVPHLPIKPINERGIN